jgi:hypothetical protein
MGGAQARALSHQSMQAKEMQAKDTKKRVGEMPAKDTPFTDTFFHIISLIVDLISHWFVLLLFYSTLTLPRERARTI